MRHVKLMPRAKLNAMALSDLIDAAYLDIKVCFDANQRT